MLIVNKEIYVNVVGSSFTGRWMLYGVHGRVILVILLCHNVKSRAFSKAGVVTLDCCAVSATMLPKACSVQ